MRVRLFVLGALGAVGLALAYPAEAPAQDHSLRLGHIFAPNHPIGQGAAALKEYVERESSGQVAISVFPAAQLGGIRSLEDSISAGLLDISNSSAPTLQTLYAPLAVITMPYTFRDEAHLQAVVNGEIGQGIYDGMRNAIGVRVLSTFNQPARHVTSNKRFSDAAGAKGLKIRVPEVASWVAYWEKLGASPTPMDFGEVVTSLQLGVIDAQENPYVTIAAFKLNEVQDYLIPTGHVRTADFLIMSEKSFDKLPADLQKIVIDGGIHAQKVVNDAWAAQSETARQTLVDGGMELIEVDVQSFRDAEQGLAAEFLSPELQELHSRIQAVQ